ncbi:MAG: hypothetical protein KGM24_11870 [Elusimicrobia bacterium]|nr:hypothetical protein [Elusimicrobiota bacterium]
MKVYRSINAADRLFGLELADGAVLLLVFFLAFTFNRTGLFANVLALVIAFVGLRLLKRGKPEGYVRDLTRHVLASRFKALSAFDDGEAVAKGDA